MEIDLDQTNKNIDEYDLENKDHSVSLLLTRQVFDELNEYHNLLILNGDERFSSISDLIRFIIKKIQRKGYETYTSKEVASKMKKLNTIKKTKNKSFSLKMTNDMYRYWRTIPKGCKKLALENAAIKFIKSNKNK